MKHDDATSADASADAAAAPTGARYGVLAFLCSLSVVLYLDRLCIGQAAKSIQKDLSISETEMGWVFSAFTLAYVLFEVPTGHWGDRYGSRGVLTRIVLWWSAFTALTGAAFGMWSLLAVRFLFGAGEAGALPNSSRVLTRWFPPEARGMARGLLITSASVGGALALPAAAYAISYVGWRWTFVLFGLVGCLWAAAFYHWFRDDPAEHPAANEAERRLIAAHASGQAVHEHLRVPWRLVLSSPNVWLMGGIMTCAAFFSYLYMNWYAKYLMEARGVSDIESGWLAGLVMAGAAVGSIIGGYFSQWFVEAIGDRRLGRRLLGSSSFVLAATCLWFSISADSYRLSAALMAAAAVCGFVQLPNWWAVAAEISGPHSGALFGLMNSLGGFGAASSPVFFGWMADRQKDLGYEGRAQWDPAFYAYVGVLLLGAVLWCFIDASKSAVERDEDRR